MNNIGSCNTWVEEKAFMNPENKRESIEVLYDEPLPSTRTGALYNAFSYPTKISAEAIALFIATHTQPGDTVLDTFGGSGTTGLAAKLCDIPTKNMIKLAFDRNITPKWGPRKAIIYELSVLGALVSKVMCTPPNPAQFEAAATDLISRFNEKYSWLWEAIDPQGISGELRHTVWSEILVCPSCGFETTFWDAALTREPLKLGKHLICRECGSTSKIDDCERATEKYYDRHLKKYITKRKRKIVRVYGCTNSKNWQRDPLKSDYKLLEKIKREKLPDTAPIEELVWGDLYRSGYHKGITHLHHFYTDRNFLVMCALWDELNNSPKAMIPSLKMLILSYNSSHSTLMTRVVIKKNQEELVLTGAQSGVLYVSGLPVEKNISKGLARKIKSLKNAFACVYESKSNVVVINKSSEKLKEKTGSVDYVFTDPPFGDYIPYAEINQINELWLGKKTNRTNEIIMSATQNKGVDQYESMMSTVFGEMARVLKKDGVATVVFHSASSSVWKALSNSYLSNGFSVQATSVLDKVQSSFKQTVSNVSVKGDPLILLTKSKSMVEVSSEKWDIEKIIHTMVKQAKKSEIEAEMTPERIYSRFISFCLTKGIEIKIDARNFYQYLESADVSK